MKFVRFKPATFWKEKERWIFDNKITDTKQFDVEWDVICELFSTAETHNGHKNAQPMFCFTNYVNNLKTDNHILKREQNVESNDSLILDIDNTEIINIDGNKTVQRTDGDQYYPIDKVSDILREYEWMLYTSFNHSKEWHKYRIILPVETITSKQQQERTKGLREVFYYADPCSFDIGRAFFMPAINPKYPKSFFSYRNSGKQFDWQPVEIVETVQVKRKPTIRTGINAADCEGKILWDTLDVVQLFKDLGLYQRDASGGKHEVLCPWHDEHSSSPDTGAAIFVDGDGCGFNCLHGSHRDRTLFHVTNYLKDLHGISWLKRYYDVIPILSPSLEYNLTKIDKEIEKLKLKTELTEIDKQIETLMLKKDKLP